MDRDEPAPSMVEILPPGGDPAIRPDRRRGAAAFRPYTPLDGRPPGEVAAADDRRRRRRVGAEPDRGRRVDLKS